MEYIYILSTLLYNIDSTLHHIIAKGGKLILDKAQILKGILEGCILYIISKENTYGYGILEKLKKGGFTDITEGTIYPLLLRLEKQGMLSSELKESPLGPQRKYYTLTPKGENELSEFLQEWEMLRQNVDRLIGRENADA